ncbi:MAG: hypothetical protein V4660_16260 [Pseudomonadota bacterium]
MKLMIVAGGLDEGERSTNEQFINLMGGKKEIWFIENAWHIGGKLVVPDEYTQKMLTFFAAAFRNDE